MSYKDYNISAALNTSQLGVSTAEGMARADVNQAIRQQMADVAQFRDDVAAKDGERVYYSSSFVSLDAAFQAWAATGGRLIINKNYDITTGILAPLASGKAYVLDCDSPRLIRFTGAHTGYAIRLYAPGTAPAPLIVSPLLTIDGMNNVNCCLWVNYEGMVNPALFTDCTIGGTYLNTRMTVAVQFPGSGPLKIDGGFDALRVKNVTVKNSTREPLAGIIGSRGSTGIEIVSLSRVMEVSDFRIENITTEDDFGTAACEGCDGLLLFHTAQQNSVGYASGPLIERGVIINARGRGIKRFALLGGGATRDIKIFRDANPISGGCYDIDHQDGGGSIENIMVTLSGTANAGSLGTVPIVFGTSFARPAGFEHEPNSIRNIAIRDTTGVTKRGVVFIAYNVGDAPRRLVKIDGVQDTGTAAVFSRNGQFGALGKATLELRNIDVSLTVAFFQTDDNLANLRVNAADVRNRGATVPVVAFLAGVEKTNGWGQWRGERITGFYRYTGAWRGMTNFHNGFYGPGGGVEAEPPEGVEEFTGPVRFTEITLAAGATLVAPPCGLANPTGGNFALRVERNDGSGYGLWTLTAGTTAFTVITAPPGSIVAQNGGVSAGAVALELWKDSATQQINFKNGTGAAITFSYTLNP